MEKACNGIINIQGHKLYTEHHSPFPNRPTLVFLHDSLGCTTLWRDFPEKLGEATQCNTLVYDRSGYGKSSAMVTHQRPVHYMEEEAYILAELVDTLGINDAILFGHSDGGSIALIAASKFPKNIKAVICEAAHIFVEDETLKGIRDAMEAYQSTDLPQRLAKYHGDKVASLFLAWTETWTREDFRKWNIEALLSGINCPLLFIQGEADEYGTLDQVEKTVSQVSGPAAKHIIPNIGHTPHKEAPEDTLKAAQNFIDRIS